MLSRALREGSRYEIILAAHGDMSIVDRYTGRPILTGVKLADEAEAVCAAINLHALRNALLMPSLAMLAAGGPDALDVWRRMVLAA